MNQDYLTIAQQLGIRHEGVMGIPGIEVVMFTILEGVAKGATFGLNPKKQPITLDAVRNKMDRKIEEFAACAA